MSELELAIDNLRRAASRLYGLSKDAEAVDVEAAADLIEGYINRKLEPWTIDRVWDNGHAALDEIHKLQADVALVKRTLEVSHAYVSDHRCLLNLAEYFGVTLKSREPT
jgi:hypothetical protein